MKSIPVVEAKARYGLDWFDNKWEAPHRPRNRSGCSWFRA